MDIPCDPPPEMRKSFPARSPAAARVAASTWLGDFGQHGPLKIRSIRVVGDHEHFEAVVTYSDMKRVTEDAPEQELSREEPLLKSA